MEKDKTFSLNDIKNDLDIKTDNSKGSFLEVLIANNIDFLKIEKSKNRSYKKL